MLSVAEPAIARFAEAPRERDVAGAFTTEALDVLKSARRHARSRTRSPRDLAYADRYADALLGRTMGVSHELYQAVGTDFTVVLDACYEQLIPEGEGAVATLKQTTAALRGLVELPNALRALPALRQELASPDCPLVDVTRGFLAAITALGHASLVERASTAVAEGWLALWQDRVSSHVQQQETHTGICLLPPLPEAARGRVLAALEIPPATLRARGTTFAAGVREYLERFAEMGAVSMTIAGATAFASRFSGETLAGWVAFLNATPEFLDQISSVMRFAQDVRFDASEPLNTGVFGLAAEQRMSIADLDSRELPVAEIEEKLRSAWRVEAREARARLEAVVAATARGGSLQEALEGLVRAVCALANTLAEVRYKS